MLPSLLEDVTTQMTRWGKAGNLDPFDEIYDVRAMVTLSSTRPYDIQLVFRMIVRLGSCRELSEDNEAIDKLLKVFWAHEKGGTVEAVLLPWLPSPSRISRDRATKELYAMLNHYVELRRKASTSSSDPLDILIQGGDRNEEIIQVRRPSSCP